MTGSSTRVFLVQNQSSASQTDYFNASTDHWNHWVGKDLSDPQPQPSPAHHAHWLCPSVPHLPALEHLSVTAFDPIQPGEPSHFSSQYTPRKALPNIRKLLLKELLLALQTSSFHHTGRVSSHSTSPQQLTDVSEAELHHISYSL